MITWQDLHHGELTVPQLYAVLKLRCAVFVVEQACAYQDVDGDDLVAENRHLLGWRGDEQARFDQHLMAAEGEEFEGEEGAEFEGAVLDAVADTDEAAEGQQADAAGEEESQD